MICRLNLYSRFIIHAQQFLLSSFPDPESQRCPEAALPAAGSPEVENAYSASCSLMTNPWVVSPVADEVPAILAR